MNIKVNAEATFNTEELSVLRKLLGRMSRCDQIKLDLAESDIKSLNEIYAGIDNAFLVFSDANKDK